MMSLLLKRSFSTIEEALKVQNVGKKLNVHGWIKGSRVQKAMAFLDVNDGIAKSGKILQVTCPSELIPSGLGHHAAVKISGTLIQSDHPGQEVELQAEKIDLVSPMSNQKYPFQPRKRYDDEFPRGFPHFRAKLNDFSTMLRIRSDLTHAIHQHFLEDGFVQIQTPILTSNDCEGAGEMFQVAPANEKISKTMKKESVVDLQKAYFDKNVYLSVSGQLHLEAICNGIEKVYTFNPAFRAEMGLSRKHLSEFCMVEAEVAFMDDMEALLKVQEELIKKSIQKLLEKSEEEVMYYLKLSDMKYKTREANLRHIEKVLKEPFKIMSFQEAKEVTKNKKIKTFKENDLGKEEEDFLVDKHCQGTPVFIIDWPKKSKAFYARQSPNDRKLVSASDLLFPQVGELCGGSLREHDYQVLKSSIEDSNIQDLDWYLDMRASGSAPMGGFGLGFERFLQFVLKAKNIRDTIPFARRPHDCKL